MHKEPDELMKLVEAARRLAVDVKTVRRYIRKGALKAHRLPSGHYRISESALKECQTEKTT